VAQSQHIEGVQHCFALASLKLIKDYTWARELIKDEIMSSEFQDRYNMVQGQHFEGVQHCFVHAYMKLIKDLTWARELIKDEILSSETQTRRVCDTEWHKVSISKVSKTVLHKLL
jgi:hypothetical protein